MSRIEYLISTIDIIVLEKFDKFAKLPNLTNESNLIDKL